MEYKDFAETIRYEVQKELGDGYELQIRDVTKNNGVILKGLSIRKADGIVAPTIYLEEYYEEYNLNCEMLDREFLIEGIVDRILHVYNRESAEQDKIVRFAEKGEFSDYENIKSRIACRLINTEANRKLLMDIPHLDYFDMSIVFIYLVEDSAPMTATILINNSQKNRWGVQTEDLYKAALENMPKLRGHEIKPIGDIISELVHSEGGIVPGHVEDELRYTGDLMYVLSNTARVDGASCILYPDLLKDFSKTIGSDFYILPSSIHEVILLPVDGTEDSDELKEMISQVNDTLLPEEFLSESLYFYDREKSQISRM